MVFKKIEKLKYNISENDIEDWVLSEMMEYYDSYLTSNAKRNAVNNNESIDALYLNAFKAQAKMHLKSALINYFIKYKHWESKKNLKAYLFKTIKNITCDSFRQSQISEVKSQPICPACKFFHQKEFLSKESDMLRCVQCTKEATRINDEIKRHTNGSLSIHLQSKFRLCSVFSLHSSKGYSCPDCMRFIPKSLINKQTIICPYSGCFFFGDHKNLREKTHPSAIKSRNHDSLNYEIKIDGNPVSTAESIIPDSSASADNLLLVSDSFKKEYSILLDVINAQINATKKSSYTITKTQRILMYQAFKNMLDKYPAEMFSYLVHLKQQPDIPLHSKIFQEYVSLVENHMPFSIIRKNEKISICSLLDKNLRLFEGISKYSAVVRPDGSIPNLTEEKYIGGRNFKDYGRCFIGKVIDIVEKDTNKSLKGAVASYSFSKIDTSIPASTHVDVTHFRILPHYEIGSLVILQKVRSNIIDKVYFKIHGKKRPKRKVNQKGKNE